MPVTLLNVNIQRALRSYSADHYVHMSLLNNSTTLSPNLFNIFVPDLSSNYTGEKQVISETESLVQKQRFLSDQNE